MPFAKNASMNKNSNFIIWGIGLAIVLACGDLISEVKMNQVEGNKAVARRVEEMYNRDVNAADEIFHPDCIHHINGSDEELRGPEAIKRSIAQMKESFSAFHTTIDELFAEGDLVAFRWTWVAKMRDSGLGTTLHGNTIFRFADGKVVEQWAMDDRLREMQELGFTLTPPAARKD
jgi:predicted SnoaL-like aldol condensation-catalyzing enzyme